MFQAGHFFAMLKRFWPLYIVTGPTLALGLVLLGGFGPFWPTVALGCVLALYGFVSFFSMQFRLTDRQERLFAIPTAIPTGIATGLVNGTTGSQIMPAIIYFQSLNLSKDEFIQAVNISFSLSTVVMFFGLREMGPLHWRDRRYFLCWIDASLYQRFSILTL